MNIEPSLFLHYLQGPLFNVAAPFLLYIQFFFNHINQMNIILWPNLLRIFIFVMKDHHECINMINV